MTNLRVLIVEDHLDTARLLGRLLAQRGYAVRVAGTVKEALAALEEPVEVIICDDGLPDGPGWDIMRLAREIRPVIGIAMSGCGLPEDIARSREAGFAEHLVKPVDILKIDETIRNLWSGAEGAQLT